ncbi:2-aminoethanethiol dioxygenase-like [Salmo trutta]|uniref:2-aminoethanethiol (cysteamine) dioxygenase b n=1 Tax=Salmo trutta TaxID=8032 RepID=A0A673ZTA9_SALTR|nr:2-aminoethanethiol dioxygenase-like [Salmo trutta]
MLRDNMTSIVQKIARQALVTFRTPSSFGDKAFLGNQCKLQSLMTEIRAADLKIAPRKVDSASTPLPHNPPVTYMHICETDEFSMGVFLLKSGASIPLHDHPGMYGMLKVLYGKVRITCFDRLDKSTSVASDTQFNPPLLPFQRGALRSILGSVGEFTEESGPCILTPDRNNLHQIDAVDGPTAFLDILAPPYDPDDGRDCHYYNVLQSASDSEDKKAEGQKEVWLMEVSQPSEFWCGGEPYPGPEVKI